MKSKYNNVIAILTIMLVIVVVITVWQWNSRKQATINKNNAQLNDVNTAYNADVQVDVKNKMATGDLTVLARNATDMDQKIIYFHIYPNTFRNPQALKGGNWKVLLGNDPKPGWIDIQQVTVNGKKSDFQVKGSLLAIPLKLWAKGKITEIGMHFTLKVPFTHATLSYSKDAIWFGNWLPIQAVYDKNGWNIDPYYPMGDPFYSETANYRVQVTMPKDYQIASSGYEGNQNGVIHGDQKTYTIHANRMRDFAMVIMDQQYTPLAKKVEGIWIKTWHLKSDNSTAVKALHTCAIQSIQYYSKHFGPYPYKEYDVMRTAGFFGGMEFPGLVYIQGDVFKDKKPMRKAAFT